MKMTPSQLENWNKLHPVGSRCTLRKDDGAEVETQTRSEAWLLGGGQVVILIEKYTGSYSLDRLTMHGVVADAPINDGGPAFPMQVVVSPGSEIHNGMSLRDWFAGQALVSLNASSVIEGSEQAGVDVVEALDLLACSAYGIADAMLKAGDAK